MPGDRCTQREGPSARKVLRRTPPRHQRRRQEPHQDARTQGVFREHGFTDVATYIQSGNVLFKSTEKDLERLTTDIEKMLSGEFNYESRVVVVSHEQLKAAVERAPKGFGSKPAEYRYDVLFLKAPLTSDEAMKSIRTKDGVDEAFAGKASSTSRGSSPGPVPATYRESSPFPSTRA